MVALSLMLVLFLPPRASTFLVVIQNNFSYKTKIEVLKWVKWLRR